MRSHNYNQNDLYDLCVSAAAAMDKPTAALQCLPSVINILSKQYYTDLI